MGAESNKQQRKSSVRVMDLNPLRTIRGDDETNRKAIWLWIKQKS